MRTFLVVFVLVSACSVSRPASAPVVSQRAEAPVVVSWVVKSAEAGRVSLVARVDRRAPLAVPLKVSVVVPANVKVVSGQTAFELPASREAEVTERSFVFSFDQVPSEDLRLVAEVHEESFGLHAEDVYRFGRPAPVVEGPQRSGPSIQVGGHDLGQGVPLNP